MRRRLVAYFFPLVCWADRLPLQYDENDPNDRRRSQYLMKAKLDEIEKASIIKVLAG